ncbi:MAG: hypothetical protein AAFY48_17280, partial [Bacteroidota bacterium]
MIRQAGFSSGRTITSSRSKPADCSWTEENPAWRIIRAAIARKDQHDPRQLEGYSYEAFHKTVL